MGRNGQEWQIKIPTLVIHILPINLTILLIKIFVKAVPHFWGLGSKRRDGQNHVVES